MMTEEKFQEQMKAYQDLGDKLTKTMSGIKINVYDEETLEAFKKFVTTLKRLTDQYVKAIKDCKKIREESSSVTE